MRFLFPQMAKRTGFSNLVYCQLMGVLVLLMVETGRTGNPEADALSLTLLIMILLMIWRIL
jgi:hypothetical protein